jgi:leucyl aminopeptidase
VPLTVELARTVPDDVEAVAVGVVAGTAPDGVDAALLAAQGYDGKRGDIRLVAGADGRPRYLVGLGDESKVDADVIRHAAGALARTAKRQRSLAIELPAGDVDAADAAQALVEGLVLGGYQYGEFKSKPTPTALERVALVGLAGKRVQAAVDRALVVTEAVCFARDLVNEPGGSLTPAKLAKIAEHEGATAGFEVTVWDEKAIRSERLGGLLGVNRGSEQAPRFLHLRYDPPGTPRATVALVGKGITFDSGGLSIKTTDGMVGMKGDMAGGAAVLGTFKAIAALGAKVRVLGFVPLTDNMTGGDATRVGDVLTIRNGTTVEVLNTDAEGRLVLADGLSLATEAEPDAIVDLATLTGACMVALGDRVAGVMGNHRGWIDQVRGAADAAGEPTWPLPLPTYLRGKLDSDIADIKNVTSARWGGALAAGIFLQEFVGEGIPWAHLDIAGPADATDVDGEIVKGGTGFGIRTLVELLTGFTKPKKAEA